jgi:hypothetical protein
MANPVASSLQIRLPVDRDLTGSIWLEDDRGGVLAGPFPIAGRATDFIAAAHGNPTRCPTLPYGDPPAGGYRTQGVVASGPGTRLRGDLYGRGGAIVLLPWSGDAALADAAGRFEVLIHGGSPGPAGGLRATSGHFRVADAHLGELVRWLGAADARLPALCEEVSTPQGSERVHDAEPQAAAEVVSPLPSRGRLSAPRIPDLVAFGEYSADDLQPIDENQAAQVGYQAESVANDYSQRGVTYQMGGDASQDDGATSDCSHFVNDVLQRSGLDIPYTTTAGMADSPHFDEVPQAEARPGDVIVQGGHMGIYSGTTDSDGHPIGTQMGNHGAREAPWGPGGWFPSGGSIKFYRPKQ